MLLLLLLLSLLLQLVVVVVVVVAVVVSSLLSLLLRLSLSYVEGTKGVPRKVGVGGSHSVGDCHLSRVDCLESERKEPLAVSKCLAIGVGGSYSAGDCRTSDVRAEVLGSGHAQAAHEAAGGFVIDVILSRAASLRGAKGVPRKGA